MTVRQEPFVTVKSAKQGDEKLARALNEAMHQHRLEMAERRKAAIDDDPRIGALVDSISGSSDSVCEVMNQLAYDASTTAEDNLEMLRRIHSALGLCFLALVIIGLRVFKVI